MKLQVLSDLHLEFKPFELPVTNSDIIVFAGDIHTGTKGVQWIKHTVTEKPVIYVLGNHEYYKNAYPRLLSKIWQEAKGTKIHILENQKVQLDGINFLGCTLWTDFKLFGNPRVAGYEAMQKMTDYKQIRRSPQYSKLRSIDSAKIHENSLEWLRKEIISCKDRNTVVVTHHAPSKRSLPPNFNEDILSAAYVSNLEDVVLGSEVKLWIHGHNHNQSDYTIGATRIICNPRGYPDEPNINFNPSLVVEI